MKHKKLEKYLKDTKQTQYKLAQLMGVNKVTIHGWLYGKRRPNCDNLKKLRLLTDNYFIWEDFHGDEAIYG